MKRTCALALTLALALAPDQAAGGDLDRSKHNLSVSGPGAVKSTSEQRTCAFCHVAHSGQPGGDNRPDSGAQHLTSRGRGLSLRLGTTVGGSSRMCLSCHDGTIAVGKLRKGREARMMGTDAGGRLGAASRSNLGLDLSGSHPVSFRPDRTPKLREPHFGDKVRLDKRGQVQCTSCHDPHVEEHDAQTRKFLVKGNRGGALCLSCHAMPGWQANPAAHGASLQPPLPPGQPVPADGYRTLADAACAACHDMHGAGGDSLVKGSRSDGQDRICLDCHGPRLATGTAIEAWRLDVASDALKPHSHTAPSAGASGHDPAEGPTNPSATLPENRPSQARHHACVDCHDPHAAVRRPAQAPRASGALAGVWGVDRSGMRVEPVNYEYEVCFKCHADSANQPQARAGGRSAGAPRRARPDVNLRRVFDPATAASSHPVVGPGQNPTIAGLVRPLGGASVIYCSDCHSSDRAAGGQAPRGPHGSVYDRILERPYGVGNPALCWKCHDQGVLYSTASGFTRPADPLKQRPAATALHDRHRTEACSSCHDAHGVSLFSGTRQNNSHLIDFDVDVVGLGAASRKREFVDRGQRSGSCNLSCHGREHRDAQASPGEVDAAY